MPRRAKGPRLYLRKARPGHSAVWIIRDGQRQVSTGCGEGDCGGAEKALATYITAKHNPAKQCDNLSAILIADVVNVYLQEVGPRTSDNGAWLAHMLDPVLDWWDGKTLGDIRLATCQAYISHRTKTVRHATARHNLKQLRAAINHYHASYGPLPAVPVVTLPPKPATRTDYWLTRDQAAQRIRKARKSPRTRHMARLILIGVYSGTRPGAIKALRWLPSASGGWFDLDSETLHRRGEGRTESKKRQPPCRIHRRLLPHLRRWKRLDEKATKKRPATTYVIHYYGRAVVSVKSAWRSIGGTADGPHILRHTAATWLLQSGVDLNEAAGYLGMSPETLWSTYGHHSPNFQSAASTASGKRR
jgi:integrase